MEDLAEAKLEKLLAILRTARIRTNESGNDTADEYGKAHANAMKLAGRAIRDEKACISIRAVAESVEHPEDREKIWENARGRLFPDLVKSARLQLVFPLDRLLSSSEWQERRLAPRKPGTTDDPSAKLEPFKDFVVRLMSSLFADALVPWVMRIFRNRIAMRKDQENWIKLTTLYATCATYAEYELAFRFFREFDDARNGSVRENVPIWAFWLIILVAA